MSKSRLPPVILAAVTATACLPAGAQTPRSVGQTFVYELTSTSNISADYSSLPAGIRGQVEAARARANKTPVNFVLTLTTDRINPDGSAHVNVSFTNSVEAGLRGADQSAFARFNQFAATLASDGRFVPQYDPNMKLTTGLHGIAPPEETHNQKAGEMVDRFASFNAFAAGCGRRRQIKPGDAWRVDIHDQYGMSRTYDFSATGAAAQVATVSMKGSFASPNGSDGIDGSGHYDMRRHLVLDLHAVDTFKNAPPGAPSSSGTTTLDYTLHQ
ncbi:MAG: hypothetical protein JO030_05450 [Candidatus Eremiobacteraeota bacterium]|nr:hypothetical protein [Candidatus Eremiobacteraeota bacterium]